MAGVTALGGHEEAIHAIVCTDVDRGVTLRQIRCEPSDLQGVVASDAIPQILTAQPDRPRARQVTQGMPFNWIGLAAPAVNTFLRSITKRCLTPVFIQNVSFSWEGNLAFNNLLGCTFSSTVSRS